MWTSDHNLPERKTSQLLCWDVNCPSWETESILASQTEKRWVFPPLSVCLPSQLKDRQRQWSFLTGICGGVRMFAHERTLFPKVRSTFFTFLCVCVRVCAQRLRLIRLMCGVCLRVKTIVWRRRKKKILLWFLSDRQTLCLHVCRTDVDRILK